MPNAINYAKIKNDLTKYAQHRQIQRAYRKHRPKAKGTHGDHIGQRDRRISIRKQAIKQYLADNHCCVCNEQDLDCLQFHHLEPKSKEHSVPNMARLSWAKIKLEIAKCVVLCANCHCKEHARLRRGNVSLYPSLGGKYGSVAFREPSPERSHSV